MIKLGELYFGGGVWYGKQILPAGWVEQTMTPSELSSEYGLMWWLDIDPHGHTTWVARGWGGGVSTTRSYPNTNGSAPTVRCPPTTWTWEATKCGVG